MKLAMHVLIALFIAIVLMKSCVNRMTGRQGKSREKSLRGIPPLLREVGGNLPGPHHDSTRQSPVHTTTREPDTRPDLPDIDRPLEEARGPAQAALRGRVVSLSFEWVHSIPARSIGCPFVAQPTLSAEVRFLSLSARL
jgi:hypothetical protein